MSDAPEIIRAVASGLIAGSWSTDGPGDTEYIRADLHEALQAQNARFKADRLFLWELLDDIDTLDDSARDSDKTFRDHARYIQQRRFEISTSDGYSVNFTGAALTDPAAQD